MLLLCSADISQTHTHGHTFVLTSVRARPRLTPLNRSLGDACGKHVWHSRSHSLTKTCAYAGTLQGIRIPRALRPFLNNVELIKM